MYIEGGEPGGVGEREEQEWIMQDRIVQDPEGVPKSQDFIYSKCDKKCLCGVLNRGVNLGVTSSAF